MVEGLKVEGGRVGRGGGGESPAVTTAAAAAAARCTVDVVAACGIDGVGARMLSSRHLKCVALCVCESVHGR